MNKALAARGRATGWLSAATHCSAAPAASAAPSPFNLAPLCDPSLSRHTRFSEPRILTGCSCCCSPAKAGFLQRNFEQFRVTLTAQPKGKALHAPFQVRIPHAEPCFMSCASQHEESQLRCPFGSKCSRPRRAALSINVGADTPARAGWPSESRKSRPSSCSAAAAAPRRASAAAARPQTLHA